MINPVLVLFTLILFLSIVALVVFINLKNKQNDRDLHRKQRLKEKQQEIPELFAKRECKIRVKENQQH